MSSPFFTHPLWSRLAETHLHFLWQGLLIAWLYWTVTKVFAVQSTRVRYALGMTGLLAMMACPIITFFLVEPPPEREEVPEVAIAETPVSLPRQPSVSRNDFHADTLPTNGNGTANSIPEVAIETDPKPPIAPEPMTVAASPGLFTLCLVGTWLVGVMILGFRLMGGVGTVLWCRWSTLPLTDPQCLYFVERLSRQLGLARRPRLAISLRAKDAFSLGLWKPLIVLPASWLLQLSPETLESVLAHELAHIRRWDAWATLFQRVLESGLFYHPGVWWLSRQMDREREKCCDVWAVSVTGDRLQYVKALAGVAEIQHATFPTKLSAPIFATGMGGKNMQLLERVRHLLGETPRTGAASRIFAGAMVLAIPVALWVGTAMLPVSAADEENTLLAQADEEREGRERGERERRDGDRREGERDRRDGDRERGERERDGDRPRDGERREGDRPRDGERREGDRPRDGERREGDRPRDGERREGDRPRDGERREGDRPRDGERREGDRPRDGEQREGDRPPRFRGGDRPRGPFPGFRRDGDPPREGERDRPREGGPRREGFDGPPQGEMLKLIRELRQEVEALRREVRALRDSRGGPEGRREGDREVGGPDRRPPGARGPDRRPARPDFRGDRPDRAREGERDEVERDRPAREREGERRDKGEVERDRPAREREGERRERDEVAREREGGEEALDRAREEREEGDEGPARAEDDR